MKALAFSGGKDSMAVLHLMRGELDCAIYVDSGYSYPETRKLVEYASTLIPMHVVKVDRGDEIPSDVVPIDWTLDGQAVTSQKPFTVTSYIDCCYAHIALPLLKKAQELGVTELYNGQRNEEGHRSTSQDGAVVFGIVRRQPIEHWTDEEVIRYLGTKMEVPSHYAIKHSSLDCYDCTAYRKDSKDRVQWMANTHPLLFKKYQRRAMQLEQALRAA